MCIDFGGSSQHVHRFSAESSTCASIFRGSSQHVRRYFWGSSQHVETDFPGKLLTCSSFLNENYQLDVHRYIEGVTNVSINFWQMFTTCASILLGSSEYLHGFSGVLNMRAAILFWGSSQHVHRFSEEVPNMCMFFFGKFESQMSTGILGKLQMSIDILCYFSHGQRLFEEEKPSKYIDFLGICPWIFRQGILHVLRF
jgi:hypothetical protein